MISLPNFIGIGAQRAATTWLYHCLKEHPEVFFPDLKEVHFYDTHFERGMEWYREQFRAYAGQKVLGEITPNYLSSEVAIPRMAETLPDAQLCVVLREPVQRAFSAYTLFSQDTYKGMNFREACQGSRYLIQKSLYAAQIQCVFRYYDRARVKIFLYDEVMQSPRGVLEDLFSFLSIDKDFVPLSIDKIYNHVLFPKAQKLFATPQLRWFSNAARKTAVGEWLKKYSTRKNLRPHSPQEEEFQGQLKSVFRPDVLKLQDLIDRDLSHWL